MMGARRYLVCSFLILLLMENSKAAPGTRSTSLEEASLQLGALQAQAQYPPAALQGARAASRSAASCLVTAVQYTHGQQIWRADPCEFCLCLDGEMFCWWQDCPPAAPGPCPGPQPFSLCGNSSGSLEKRPTPATKKNKKTSKKGSDTTAKKTKKQSAKFNIKPLITTSQNTTFTTTAVQEQMNNTTMLLLKNTLNKTNALKTNQTSTWQTVKSETKEQPFYSSMDMVFNFTNNDDSKQSSVQSTQENTGDSNNWFIENEDENINNKNYIKDVQVSKDASKTGCIIMGKEYHVGEMLPSTGSCLSCRCIRGNGEDSPAKVACAPRGCAPPDPAPQDDTGAFEM